MNTDIRISTTFRNSRKRKRLARQLGDNAVVCLVDLWIAVALARPEGRLDGWDEQDIADEAGWGGEPEIFVNALLDLGLLDRLPDKTFVIHNWEKHNPWVAGAVRRSHIAKKAAANRWGYEFDETAPAGSASPAAPQAKMPEDGSAPASPGQLGPANPAEKMAPAPKKAPAVNGEQKTPPDNTGPNPNPKAPVLPSALPNPPGPAAQAVPPAQGDLAESGPGIIRQDATRPAVEPDFLQKKAGGQNTGQEDAVQEDDQGHPYNNDEQDRDLCYPHAPSNAHLCREHALSNALLCREHALSNAPSPSPSPNPYPYPNPSPSPSPGPSPGAGSRAPPAGSVRARASPQKRQTRDKASSNKFPPCPQNQIIGLFHQCLPENPKVEAWTKRNKAELNLAWRADPARQSLVWWQDFFLRLVAPNRFLTGKKGDFAASLGWMAKPEVFGRILTGYYRDFTPSRDQGPALWYMEQTNARQGQNGLCQVNGSPLQNLRPGGAAGQDEDGHLF